MEMCSNKKCASLSALKKCASLSAYLTLIASRRRNVQLTPITHLTCVELIVTAKLGSRPKSHWFVPSDWALRNYSLELQVNSAKQWTH